MKILIGGGSGFIGRSLQRELTKRGHQVTFISRGKNNIGVPFVTWDELAKQPEKSFPECDVVIQIPGANIMDKKWTPERKREIEESRIGTSKILINAINKSSKVKKPPSLIISGSATGIYPQTNISNPQVMTEDVKEIDPTFAGNLCKKWEDTLNDLDKNLNIRQVISRTSVTISKNEGPFKNMLMPFKFGLGTTFGNGQQYFPWMHIDDLVSAFIFAIENDKVSGPVNMTAPQLLTNEEFSKKLGKILKRPVFLNVPESILDFALGERSPMLTKGAKVEPKKLKDLGFKWKVNTLEEMDL